MKFEKGQSFKVTENRLNKYTHKDLYGFYYIEEEEQWFPKDRIIKIYNFDPNDLKYEVYFLSGMTYRLTEDVLNDIIIEEIKEKIL